MFETIAVVLAAVFGAALVVAAVAWDKERKRRDAVEEVLAWEPVGPSEIIKASPRGVEDYFNVLKRVAASYGDNSGELKSVFTVSSYEVLKDVDEVCMVCGVKPLSQAAREVVVADAEVCHGSTPQLYRVLAWRLVLASMAAYGMVGMVHRRWGKEVPGDSGA